MRYLLDTCVISDFIKGEAGTIARLKQTPPVDVAISAIAVMELRCGVALNPQRGADSTEILRFVLMIFVAAHFSRYAASSR